MEQHSTAQHIHMIGEGTIQIEEGIPESGFSALNFPAAEVVEMVVESIIESAALSTSTSPFSRSQQSTTTDRCDKWDCFEALNSF